MINSTSQTVIYRAAHELYDTIVVLVFGWHRLCNELYGVLCLLVFFVFRTA